MKSIVNTTKKIPKVKLYRGDCMKLLSKIPDQSVSLILCDMPYGITANKWDSVLPLKKLWKEYNRICKGAIVLTAQTPFDKVLGASNIKNLKYEWIWEKSNATGHLNAKRMPMKAHENILVFYSKPPTYNPIKTNGHGRSRATRRVVGKSSTNYGDESGVHHYDSTERYPRSVLQFPKDVRKSALHPTQKPLALMEYLVRTYTNPNDVILDNCMGSGTTGVAAVNLGRKFIGIELKKKYYRIARDRIFDALQKKKSRGGWVQGTIK